MRKLAFIGLLVGSLALTSCVVRSPRAGSSHHAVKGKHTHKHCHRKNKKHKVCHAHPHVGAHH